MSRPYAEVIGDPIAQSKSPAIHGFWLRERNIPADYRAFHVKTDELSGYLEDRRGDPRWRGCNVTMPHKQAIMPLLDRLDPLAARIGAVNTVVREADGALSGYNTDAPGFLEPLAGRVPRVATVIGAGGAARAVLVALADAGVEWVSLRNRSLGKAEALLAELAIPGRAEEIGGEVRPEVGAQDRARDGAKDGRADLLVNTSALGMTGHPPLPENLLSGVRDGGTVYDIVTSPLDTQLLRNARGEGRGLVTIDGLSMLIGQADHAFRRFFGQPPPRGSDSALRALLAG